MSGLSNATQFPLTALLSSFPFPGALRGATTFKMMENPSAENPLELLSLLADRLAQVERNLREATTPVEFEMELAEIRRIVATLSAF